MSFSSFSPALLLVLYCTLVLVAALAGGWLIFALRLNHTRLQIALSAVAGLMLGIALLHFMPHAIHHNHSVEGSMQWALGGFLLMFFLQRLFHYHHHHAVEHTTPPTGSLDEAAGLLRNASASNAAEFVPADSGIHGLSWVGTTIGLSLHSLVDGVALAAAAFLSAPGQSSLAGLGVALAVILHKPFGAMAISTLMTAEGCSRFLRQLVNFLFALVTPLGALLFFMGMGHTAGANAPFQGNALAFCAGTFLCLACGDLLPELQFHSHDRLQLSLALLAGLMLAFLLGHFGHADHNSHHHATMAAPPREVLLPRCVPGPRFWTTAAEP